MGWLHSTPESKSKEKVRRYDSFHDDSLGLLMPEVDELLLSVFAGVGMYSTSMNGAEKISFSEMSSYLQLMGIELFNWEKRAVLDMSLNYCSWLNKGKENDCECPWHDSDYTDELLMKEKGANIMKAFKLMPKKMKE